MAVWMVREISTGDSPVLQACVAAACLGNLPVPEPAEAAERPEVTVQDSIWD